MTPALFAGICLAGGLGAALRFLVDGAVGRRSRSRFPWGIWWVNVSGSLVLGFLTGIAVTTFVPAELHVILGVGLLGGYTTFSTASFDTVSLIRERRYRLAVINGIGMVVACVTAAAVGYVLGRPLF